MHDTNLPPADGAIAARLQRYFDAESIRAEAAATRLLAPAEHRRGRPFAIRFAPLGGGFALLAVLAIALAFLPFRGGGATGGSGGSPSAVADASSLPSPSVVYEGGVPVRIDGERVYHTGSEIAARLAGPGSFLVAGTLAQQVYDCAVGRCPASGATVLLVADSTHPQGFPLLTAGAVWGADPGRWRGDIVVLRVRTYDAACPWADYCKSALLVEAAIPPR